MEQSVARSRGEKCYSRDQGNAQPNDNSLEFLSELLKCERLICDWFAYRVSRRAGSFIVEQDSG